MKQGTTICPPKPSSSYYNVLWKTINSQRRNEDKSAYSSTFDVRSTPDF